MNWKVRVHSVPALISKTRSMAVYSHSSHIPLCLHYCTCPKHRVTNGRRIHGGVTLFAIIIYIIEPAYARANAWCEISCSESTRQGSYPLQTNLMRCVRVPPACTHTHLYTAYADHTHTIHHHTLLSLLPNSTLQTMTAKDGCNETLVKRTASLTYGSALRLTRYHPRVYASTVTLPWRMGCMQMRIQLSLSSNITYVVYDTSRPEQTLITHPRRLIVLLVRTMQNHTRKHHKLS
jgi:hypothetical protein